MMARSQAIGGVISPANANANGTARRKSDNAKSDNVSGVVRRRVSRTSTDADPSASGARATRRDVRRIRRVTTIRRVPFAHAPSPTERELERRGGGRGVVVGVRGGCGSWRASFAQDLSSRSRAFAPPRDGEGARGSRGGESRGGQSVGPAEGDGGDGPRGEPERPRPARAHGPRRLRDGPARIAARHLAGFESTSRAAVALRGERCGEPKRVHLAPAGDRGGHDARRDRDRHPGVTLPHHGGGGDETKGRGGASRARARGEPTRRETPAEVNFRVAYGATIIAAQRGEDDRKGNSDRFDSRRETLWCYSSWRIRRCSRLRRRRARATPPRAPRAPRAETRAR